jgi:hypothetical protein
MLGHVVRMDGERTVKKLLRTNKKEGRRKRRHRIRWIDDAST